ncbi:MAG: HAD-IA family hydrolase [Deinococcaceae bacterium]
MLEALIFDFDGTLLDTETAEFEAYRELYVREGLTLSLDSWQQGVGTWDGFDPWEPFGHYSDPERALLKQTLRQGLWSRLEALEPREGVLGLLDEAFHRGIRVAIASASDRDWIERWGNRHGLLKHVEVLVSRDHVDRVKPDPEAYQLALRWLGVHSKSVLAIEDSLHGYCAATAAGLPCLVFLNPVTQGMAFPPDAHVCETLNMGLEVLVGIHACQSKFSLE